MLSAEKARRATPFKQVNVAKMNVAKTSQNGLVIVLTVVLGQ